MSLYEANEEITKLIEERNEFEQRLTEMEEADNEAYQNNGKHNISHAQ